MSQATGSVSLKIGCDIRNPTGVLPSLQACDARARVQTPLLHRVNGWADRAKFAVLYLGPDYMLEK